MTGPSPRAGGQTIPQEKAVTRVLPRVSRQKGHHTALPYGEVPAARSGEVRLATWPEIGLEPAT